MSTTLTTKGQVTIPKKLRDHLRLKAGSAVDFELNEQGEVVLRPVAARGRPAQTPRSRFDAVRGTIDLGMSTDDYMNLIRGYDQDANDP